MNNYSEKFEKMKLAGRLAAQTLDMLTDNIREGISTAKIDQLGYEFIRDNGATLLHCIIEDSKNLYAHLSIMWFVMVFHQSKEF